MILKCPPHSIVLVHFIMCSVVSFRCDGSVKVPLHLLMTVICQPFSLVPDKLVGGAHLL